MLLIVKNTESDNTVCFESMIYDEIDNSTPFVLLSFSVSLQISDHLATGRERLIRSHSSARFSFELSGNSN